MKSKIIGALVAAAALATTGCATEQASPQCLVAHGDFIVKYYPKDTASAQCGFKGSRGEILSLDRYVPTETSPAQVGLRLPAYLGNGLTWPGPVARNPDGSLRYAMNQDPPGTQGIDMHWQPDASLDEKYHDAWFSGLHRGGSSMLVGDDIVATAQFDESDAPDADNYCRVSDFGFTASAGPAYGVTSDASNFEEMSTNNPAKPEETIWVIAPTAVEVPLQGEQESTYAFKNVEFYVTTRSPGVTFRGDLTFTQTTVGADPETCTGEFTVIGLAPSFGGANRCGTDADCDPCGYDTDGSYIGGSGIIPDLDIACDHDLYGGFCFLRETTDGQAPELPAFRDDAALADWTAKCQANQRGEG